MNTSTETLMAHLRVRTHGVKIITARMIGTTKSAAITFFSPTLPRTVYYYGGELRCYPFRPTIQVCKLRLVRGGSPHRNPTCKKRLKPPKPKQPQVQAGHSDKLQQGTSNDQLRTKNLCWFSSEEEENAYKSADDKHSSRSHSWSPGRKPHSPFKKSAPAPTQQNLHRSPPGGGAKGNGGDQGCTQQASSLPTGLQHFRLHRKWKGQPPQPGFNPATCVSAAEYLSHWTTVAGQAGKPIRRLKFWKAPRHLCEIREKHWLN
ncbi:hypothetical protein HPB51_029285 [Rhipicephalus microplus]|uniref:Uncharacterized protein n=1 Tax=Rhipicephalus microplus TaxID=6941 RepID=A0A9J6CVA8_RHIMP|nr:hypothetical protein HPB51_029285 [Rhipicephalus microplus]